MRLPIAIALLAALSALGQTPAAPEKAAAPAPAKSAASGALPSYKDLKYPPMPQVKIPEPAQFTLSNGMRIFLLEDHELPLIRGLALIRTGNLFDTSENRGTSEIMADVMRSGGTKSKTGDQIDEELENLAASVESGMEESTASMTFSALKESSDAVLATFKDVLTGPEFRQDKIDLEITQLRSSIARRNDDASAIPDRELSSLLYGRNNSYGWEIEYANLDRIHRDDLIQFYRRYYFPKNVMLAVYGDFSTAEMKDKLEKLFAGWTVEQPPVPPFPAVTAKPAPGVYLGEKPDVTQTFFAIGELGGTLRDKDYPALQVAAHILGEGFSSRLVSEIRTKLGYVYDVSAVWAAQYNHPGTFQIDGSTKSASTTDAILAIKTEVDKMRTAEVTERELAEAKQGVLNSFVFFFDSPAKTLNRVMRYAYYDYPKDFLFEYQKAIAAVTRADVLRAAKEHFIPENLAIVAIGNSKEFGKPLSTLGRVTTLDLTIPEPKQAVSAPDAASLARGKAILQRAQQAMGGVEKIAAIKDETETAEMVMNPSPGGGMKVKQLNRYILSGQFRTDQELPFGKVIVYSDGKTGWIIGPQGPAGLPPAVLKQTQGEMFRNLPHIILSDRDPSLTVNAVGPGVVEISSPDGMSTRIEMDPASGLPARQMWRETSGGQPASVEERFSDWREVGGVKVPFKVALTQDGKDASALSVQDYKFNTGLKPEDLNKRP
jgi:predicted Zn-dependent peptidase